MRKKISDIVGSNFNLSKLNVAIRESEQPEEVIMALAAVLSLVRQNNRKCWNDLFRRYVKTYSSVLVKHFFLEESDEKEEKLVVKDTLLFLQLISVLIHTNIFPEMTYAQIRDAPAEGKSGRNGRTGNVPQKGPGRFSEEGFELNRTSNSFIHKPILPVYTTISVPKNRAEIVFFSPANLSTFAVPKRRNGNDR